MEKTSYQERKQAIINLVDGMDIPDSIRVWNDYCEKVGYNHSIHPISHINNFCGSAYSLLCCLQSYNINHDYFILKDHGIIATVDAGEVWSEMDLDALAEFCLENDHDLYTKEIRKLLTQFYEEDMKGDDE